MPDSFIARNSNFGLWIRVEIRTNIKSWWPSDEAGGGWAATPNVRETAEKGHSSGDQNKYQNGSQWAEILRIFLYKNKIPFFFFHLHNYRKIHRQCVCVLVISAIQRRSSFSLRILRIWFHKL